MSSQMVSHVRPQSPPSSTLPVHLPVIEPAVVDVVVDMLMTDQPDVTKPPTVAAALLVLIAELHERGHPFPPRAAVAEALGCNIYSIDAALSTRTAQGYITRSVKVVEGNVAARPSVVTQRCYTPSPRLRQVIKLAKKRVAA